MKTLLEDVLENPAQLASFEEPELRDLVNALLTEIASLKQRMTSMAQYHSNQGDSITKLLKSLNEIADIFEWRNRSLDPTNFSGLVIECRGQAVEMQFAKESLIKQNTEMLKMERKANA